MSSLHSWSPIQICLSETSPEMRTDLNYGT